MYTGCSGSLRHIATGEELWGSPGRRADTLRRTILADVAHGLLGLVLEADLLEGLRGAPLAFRAPGERIAGHVWRVWRMHSWGHVLPRQALRLEYVDVVILRHVCHNSDTGR